MNGIELVESESRSKTKTKKKDRFVQSLKTIILPPPSPTADSLHFGERVKHHPISNY